MIQHETSASARGRTPDIPVGPVRTCVGCRKRELAVELQDRGSRASSVDHIEIAAIIELDVILVGGISVYCLSRSAGRRVIGSGGRQRGTEVADGSGHDAT